MITDKINHLKSQHMTQQAKLITITPKLAEAFLENNGTNRPLKSRHITGLARAMKEGDWKINGDTIRMSKSGTIIDGQHRLHAVVRSQITIQSWIIVGLDNDVFDTIDIGKKRTVADTLSCRGEKNTTTLASSLRLLNEYYCGTVETNALCSTTDIEKVLEENPDMRESIFQSKGLKELATPAVICTCNYLFRKTSRQLAEIFFLQLSQGTGLEKGYPVHTLRERLVANALSKSKLSTPYIFALFIIAFNHLVRGTKVYSLKVEQKDGKMINFPKVAAKIP
jgi:hypothetical protein